MKRQERRSRIAEKAERRAKALKQIDSKLDLGKGLTLGSYEKRIDETKTELDLYNSCVKSADTSRVRLVQLERGLGDLSNRMLKGVASQYGEDSEAYQLAGGVRKSLRRRPVRLKKSKVAELPEHKKAV